MNNSYTKPVLFFDDNPEEFLGNNFFLNNIVECVPISRERYNFFDNNPNDPNHINNSKLPYYFLYNNYFSENKYFDESIIKFLYYFQKTENKIVIDESVWTELQKDINEMYDIHQNNIIFLLNSMYNFQILKLPPKDKELFKKDAETNYDIFYKCFLLLQTLRVLVSDLLENNNLTGQRIKNIITDVTMRNGTIRKNIQTICKMIESTMKDLENATMGLTREQMDKIVDWTDNFLDKKTIVFDWDGTMTVVGGFNASKFSNKNYIQFIFGGPPRLERIKQLFKTLHEKNVEIYILTRNKAASEKREEFLNIIHMYLDENFSEENLIYAKDYRKSAKISFLQTKFIDCTIKKLQKLQQRKGP